MRGASCVKFLTVCSLLIALAAAFWSHPKPIHAQQNTGETYTGSFYMSAYIDIDSGDNAYGTSLMQSDGGEESDFVGVDGYLLQDTSTIAYDSNSDYQSVQVSFSSDGPVAPGHNYQVQTDGYACSVDDEDGDDCDDVEYVASAYASVYVYQPPIIDQLNPSSVTQGDQNTLTITGRYLVQDSSDQLTINLAGSSAPFLQSGAPSANLATFSYDFTSYPVGTYTLSVTNNEGTSNGVTFTVSSKWPDDPCAVGSSPKTQYSALVPTGVWGSGNLIVTFSGAAYSTVSQTVPYGPYSTPDSVAAHIAALITANYTQYGLTARSFGPNVIYSGSSEVGTVTISESSFTTTVSSTAASAAKMACMVAPASPVPVCGDVNPAYVLAVTYDSVSWKDDGMDYGRNVNYSLEYPPTRANTLGAPTSFQSTVTEHLSATMAYGRTSVGNVSGQFNDYLGSTAANQSGFYITDRCFSVTSPTLGNLGHIVSYDAAGRHPADHIQIQPSTKTTILNYWTNPNGSSKDISIP